MIEICREADFLLRYWWLETGEGERELLIPNPQSLATRAKGENDGHF